MLLETRTLYLKAHVNCDELELAKERRVHLVYLIEIFVTKFVFYLRYSVLNKLSIYYLHFYLSKNITSYNFMTVFKIVKSLKCILKFISLEDR